MIPDQQQVPYKGKKKRTSRQPIPVQSAAIAKYAMNESKIKIAKDLGLARETLDTILNSAEIEQCVLSGRSRAIQLIPKSLDVAEYRLSKNDGSMAIAIMRGTNVLRNEQVTANVNNIGSLNIWQLKQERAQEELATAPKPAIDVGTTSTLPNNEALPSTNDAKKQDK